MRRKSLLAPSLFTLFGLALLIGLGTWQLERLRWKEGLIAERHEAATAPPAPLPTTLDAARPLDFHRVRAEGRFRDDKELYLHATDAAGDDGWHVITPLALTGGGTLLVDRGFVPSGKKNPASRAAGEIAGDRAVTGLLRVDVDGRPGWFVPDNRPERDEWFFIDIPAMAKAAGIADALPFHLDVDATPNPGGWPRGGQTPLDLPNNHLQYAITWYALALGLVAVYIRLVMRRRAGEGS